MKKLLTVVLALFILMAQPVAAIAGSRVFNAPRPTFRLLKKQFNASADVFAKVDPSPVGTPLTLTSATGTSKMDGSATVCFTTGFTAPMVVTIYEWQQDNVTAANACWVRIGGAAAQYSFTVDTKYAVINFAISENTPFLVMCDQSVTGNVYVEAPENINNANTVAGYPKQ